MFKWRVSIVWQVIAWLSPLLLFLAAVLVTGWNHWDLQSFGQSDEYPELPALVYWLASILFYGWGEETGWRGFALPYLQTRQSALQATYDLGVAILLIAKPKYLSAVGKLVVNQTENSYCVFVKA